MMTAEILQLMSQKGLNQLDSCNFFTNGADDLVFCKILYVACHTLLPKSLKILILGTEGSKHSTW